MPEIEDDFIDDIDNQVNETDNIEMPKNLHCDPNFAKSFVSNPHVVGTGVRNDVSKKSTEDAVTRNRR